MSTMICLQDPLNFDPTPFAYTGVNFITTQLGNQLHSPPLSPSSSSSTPASTQSTPSTTSSLPPFNKFSNTDVMLIKDSLLTLYRAIMMTYALRHNCTWKGQQDINSIRLKISEKTESGQLKFLKDGSRVGYFLDVLWLRENGFKKVEFTIAFCLNRHQSFGKKSAYGRNHETV
ncbi:hypothetical protein HELRODRAFT_170791 [Helobdella robusta]|uniref:Uncharacterized protein n=1 Tax=Helobdella robusta TaxID=6412 RepID=T1F3F4_HELRO|nr:hypothetical protein HELRODRAFT_170791 [Helobdella robusta]ESO06775.1 hypothetical protein HELRODRAFT_170791 [Helobdella robusta]